MNRKFQRSARRFWMSFSVRVALHAAVILARRAKRLVHLLHHVADLEVRRRLHRIVVAHQSEADANHRQELSASRIVDLGHVARQTVSVEEGGDGNSFLGFLVDHQRHADAAVRVASAGELAPLVVRPVNIVRPVRKSAHKADREPVADRLAQPRLVLHIMRQDGSACSAAHGGDRR